MTTRLDGPRFVVHLVGTGGNGAWRRALLHRCLTMNLVATHTLLLVPWKRCGLSVGPTVGLLKKISGGDPLGKHMMVKTFVKVYAPGMFWKKFIRRMGRGMGTKDSDWPFKTHSLEESNIVAHSDGGTRGGKCSAAAWIVEIGLLSKLVWNFHPLAMGGSYYEHLCRRSWRKVLHCRSVRYS